MVDRMSSQERMGHFYSGEKVDRVPFMSSATMYSGRMMGLTSHEFYFEPEKSYHAQKWVLEMLSCDGGPCFDLPNWEVLDFGGSLTFADESKVVLPHVNFPIHTLEEAEKFEIPARSERNGLQEKLKFIRYTHSLGATGAGITGGSPFTILGSLVETSTLLRWLKKEPQMIHKLMKQVEEYLLDNAEILIEEFGVSNCSVGANVPFESGDLISRKIFEEFAFPYMYDIHEKLRAKGLTSFSLHLCGNQMNHMDRYKELNFGPGSFISTDEKNDFDKIVSTFGEEMIYAGNVPTSLLVSGDPEEVYRYSGEIIQKMKFNPGGFVLMPSCDLPINARPVNLYAMLKACRDFGSYE